MAYIEKEISRVNKEKWEIYGEEHKGKTLDDFWVTIVYTDEAHVDPSSLRQ